MHELRTNARPTPLQPGIVKTLPFRDDMAALIREGRKTATTRTKKYGEVGDVLATKAGPVRLTRVIGIQLREVARHFYLEEGFDSPSGFRAAWTEIHPRAGFRPEDRVYVHFFTPADSNSGDA